MRTVDPVVPIVLLIIGFTLCIAPLASAGPFEDGLAAYQRDDYATALRLWRPLANHGDSDAQYRLGRMYLTGLGVARDRNVSMTLRHLGV